MSKRKPLVIEFTGTPEAGKTTTISILEKVLEISGYSVKVVKESAEDLPTNIPKGTWYSHSWMLSSAMSYLIESYFCDADIILVDRGYIDTYFFNLSLYHRHKCTDVQYEIIDKYLGLYDFLMPDCAIFFKVSPIESISRRGGEGKIVTNDFISSYNLLLDDFVTNIKIPYTLIDTTHLSIDSCVSQCKDFILKYYI